MKPGDVEVEFFGPVKWYSEQWEFASAEGRGEVLVARERTFLRSEPVAGVMSNFYEDRYASLPPLIKPIVLKS